MVKYYNIQQCVLVLYKICTDAMEKPVEPKKEDCCESGCNPCIFDIYEKQLKLYENHLENEVNFNDYQQNGIAQLEYTKFIVIKNVNLCKSHNLILFKRSKMDGKKVWWKPGDHLLFKYISNGISCTRAYTPIILRNVSKNDYDFAIVIKKYENGLVSTYLYSLSEGCATLWRGPYGHYELKPNLYNRIIMITQGTGIVPFITIIDTILNNEDDMTRIIVLYCCKFEDTILFRDELYEYKSYWNFQYEIYLSNTLTKAKIRYKEPIKECKLSSENLCNYQPFTSKDQFLICGSQQFNEHFDKLIRTHKKIENIVLF